MHTNDLNTLSQQTVNIERWIIPILAILIIVVGGIRATPWVKSQFPNVFSSNTVAVENPTPDTNAQNTVNIQIDTELAPMIMEQNVPLNEVRSQKLTNSLSSSKSEPTVKISVASDDLILTQDVSAPDQNQKVIDDITALEIITALRKEVNELAKLELPVPDEAASKPASIESEPPSNDSVLNTENITPSTSLTELASTVPALDSTPTIEPTLIDSQSLQNENKDLIASLVYDWAAAWSAGSSNLYFQSYSPEMSTARYPSYGKWRAWRKSRLSKTGQIEVQIDELKINLEAEKDARATFTQRYRTDNYADKVLKELKLVHKNGRWLIYQEQTLETL